VSQFVKLYQVTEQLYEHVVQPLEKDGRDSYIGKLSELIEERARIIEAIGGVKPTEGEAVILKRAVERNEQMGPRLQEVLNSVKKDMLNLKKKKQTGQRYENPYDHAPLDGAFIDKKN
jgi:flagellar protein FliT